MASPSKNKKIASPQAKATTKKTKKNEGKASAVKSKASAVKTIKKATAKPKKVAAKAVKKTTTKVAKKTAPKASSSKKKTTKATATKKAVSQKTAVKKKVAAKTKTATSKKSASASAKTTSRDKKTKDSVKKVISATLPSNNDSKVLLAYPQSTIVGAKSHKAADASSAVIAIHSAKYEVTPPEQVIEPVYLEEVQTELPVQYGDTQIVLMVRDPEWLFLYWDISEEEKKIVGVSPERFTEALVIRLHDVTEVDEFNGLNSLSWYEIPIEGEVFSWYVHVPAVDREWIAELGVLNEEGEFIQICRSNKVRTPRNFISSVVDSKWMTISQELQALLSRSADMAIAEGLSTEAAIKRITRRLRLSLEQQAASPGASGLFRARQPRAAAKEQPPDLPLAVRTELVVSGSTDPQATLSVQNNPIDLRPDGTFSMRFELPDGEQVVQVRAISSDGTLTRQIIPIVRKETRDHLED